MKSLFVVCLIHLLSSYYSYVTINETETDDQRDHIAAKDIPFPITSY